MKDASHQGLHKGATFHWNVYSDVATAGTTLVETNTMPETQFTVTQGTMTIDELGNSVPFTQKVQDLAEHAVTEVVDKALKNDAKKALDKQAHAQFALCKLRVVPTGGTDTAAVTLTTNGTATLTNNIALNKDHVKSIVDVMKERNIAPYRGDDYFALAWPTTYRTFKNNLESIHQYVDAGFGLIMRGEIGRYESTRFIEQTNVAKGTGSTANAAWSNAKSDWAFFFGEDTVAEAIAVPEEIRAKIPSDYGRSHGVAWYYLGGFGLVHTTASESRVVMWDSAV